MPTISKPVLSLDDGKEDTASPTTRRKKEVNEIDVNSLFEGARAVALVHRGDIYSLRITANGKLILTK